MQEAALWKGGEGGHGIFDWEGTTTKYLLVLTYQSTCWQVDSGKALSRTFSYHYQALTYGPLRATVFAYSLPV